MNFVKTAITGLYILEPTLFYDHRGYFTRIFSESELKKQHIHIAEINKSFTLKKGTIRGLHYQNSPMQQDKIVHCVQGSIFDVGVDLRKKSKTYGTWVGEILSAENKKMLLVPKGFAHGFQALENNTMVEYFVTQYYSPSHERGILWNDPTFAIQWPVKKTILSQKDKSWPLYKI